MNKEAYIVQEADRIPLTLEGNVDVGDIVRIGKDLIGIAAVSGIAGETITVYVGGVVAQAQAAQNDAIEIGDKLYFDHKNRVLTKSADDGAGESFNPAGHAVTSKAANSVAAVQFLLNR